MSELILKTNTVLNQESELKQVTYVAMKADYTDAHGDYTSLDEVRKAKESFNHALSVSRQMTNLFHISKTEKFSVVESYQAPADFQIGEHLVKSGDWLMTLQVHDDDLWEMVKNGEIVGLSIGAVAQVENVE